MKIKWYVILMNYIIQLIYFQLYASNNDLIFLSFQCDAKISFKYKNFISKYVLYIQEFSGVI